MVDTVKIEIKEICTLQQHEKEELILFAKKTGILHEDYIEKRFFLYKHVIILKKNNKVGCFQFIEYKNEKDEIFIYFGPLFSKMSRFLPLFLDFFLKSVDEGKEKKLHLLAEIQNPEVLLVFKALFGIFSYPHIEEPIIPSEIKRIAEYFSSKLSHMGKVNLENLSTKSKESLYIVKPQFHEVNQWLLRRGIDLSQGDNVLFIVTVPNKRQDREELLTQLCNGIAMTKNWREGKRIMLKQFQEGM